MKTLRSTYIRVRTYTTAFLLGVAIQLTLTPLNATTVPQDVNGANPFEATWAWIVSLFS